MMLKNDVEESGEIFGFSNLASLLSLMEFLSMRPEDIKSSQFVEVAIISPFLLILFTCLGCCHWLLCQKAN